MLSNLMFSPNIDRVFISEIAVGILAFFIAFLFFKRKNPFFTVLLILFITTLMTFLFVLRTRAAWISVFVCIIFIFVFYLLSKNSRKDLNLFFGTVAIIVIITIAYFIGATLRDSRTSDRKDLTETVKSIFDKDFHSNKARFNYWETSWKMFQEKPLTGIGGGNWFGLYPIYNGGDFNDEIVSNNAALNPHNDYIHILTEYGVFGFFTVMGFIGFGLYRLFKKSKIEIIYLPFMLSAISLLVCAFFLFTKENFIAMTLFFLNMAVAYYPLKNDKSMKIFYWALFILLTLGWFGCGGLKYYYQKEYFHAMEMKAKGQYSEMTQKLNTIPEWIYPIDPNRMPLNYYKGVGYYELKQYDKALICFQDARKYALYIPSIISNEASAYYMSGNKENALKDLYFLKDNFPNYIEPKVNLLAIYANNKQDIEAKELLKIINRDLKDTTKIKNYNVFLQIREYYNEKAD